MINKSMMIVAIVASLGSAAFAQGPAGGSQGGAATIPGSEVRAGEPGSRLDSSTVGSSTLRSETSTTAVTPNGTRVDTTIVPGGLVGSEAPSATSAAPAGR